MKRKGYKKPTYSEETYRGWEEAAKRRVEYHRKHTHVTEKVYKVNDLYIFCKKTEYDECLKNRENRENFYIISIWEEETRMDLDKCLVHKVYKTREEANEAFKFWKAECEIG